MGYTTYYRFASVIKKAIAVAPIKRMEVNNHFHLIVEMVRLALGAYKNVENFHLSRMIRLIIAENADSKKILVQRTHILFKN